MRLFFDEPGADDVEHIIEGEELVLLPFMTVMEVTYVLRRKLPPVQVEHMIAAMREWPTTTVESNPEWGQRAAEVKSRGGLSVADAWNAALALMHEAQLVHKDSEFDAVEGLRAYHLPD